MMSRTSDLRVYHVQVRHLVALQAIAEEGSFGRAATRLGYTQSAVSHQIAALERLVGQRLIERPGGPRPVRLTAAGERLHEHARGIVARALAAWADLEQLAEGAAGLLRIGIYQSAGARILPRVLRRYRRELPKVTLQLTETSDGSDLLQLVESGELDVCFAFMPLREGPFAARELLVDPWVLLVAGDHPLALRSASPSLPEIAGLPLIAWHDRRGSRGIEPHLRAIGYEPNIILRSDDSATIRGLVAAGIGAAIVPRLTVEANDALVAIDLDALPAREIALAWHAERQLPPAVSRFVDLAADVCAAEPAFAGRRSQVRGRRTSKPPVRAGVDGPAL